MFKWGKKGACSSPISMGAIDGISASCKNASSATFYPRPCNKGWNLRWYFVRHKMFYLFFKKKTFCTGCFRLRYFTITCNADEYKMMGQDLSLGQLYDVHNWIEISKTILWAQLMILNRCCNLSCHWGQFKTKTLLCLKIFIYFCSSQLKFWF